MDNLYAVSAPIVAHKLRNLKHIVAKGAVHAAEHGLDETALTKARLFPDMLPFDAQVRIATDLATGMVMRLTDAERLTLPDTDSSFAELDARLDTVIAHLNGQDSDDYAGSANKTIVMKFPFGEMTFKGDDYLYNFLMPNLYFHITTAYNLLRHNGVKLGKMDYMQGAQAAS